MTTLALSLSPAPHETPSSYLSRLASRNGAESMMSFCLELGLDLRKIANGDTKAICELCELAGLDAEAFVATTVSQPTRSIYRVGGETFDLQTLNRTSIRVCPSCLKEQHKSSKDLWRKVHPLHWQIPQIVRCPIHNERLLKILDEKIGFERLDTSAAIAASWSFIEAANHSEQADNFELYLYSRLKEGMGTTLCDELSIPSLWRIAEALGILLSYGTDMRRAYLTSEQNRHAFLRGFDLIHAGEEAVRKSLTEFSECQTKARGYLPPPQFGELQRLLSRKFDLSRDLEPFRRVMHRHVISLYPIPTGASVFGSKAPKQRLYTFHAAQKKLGMRKDVFHEILRENSINPDIRPTLTIEQIESMRQQETRFLFKKDAGKFLGVSEGIFKEIHQSGLLAPKLGHEKRAKKAYDSMELQKVLDQVFEDLTVHEKAPQGLYTLPSITRMVKCGTPVIIDLLLRGRLKARGRVGLEKALSNALIAKEELLAALPTPTRNGYTRKELCHRWTVSEKSVKKLNTLGLLTPKRMKHSHSRVTNFIFPVTDVHAFERAYIIALWLLVNQPEEE